MGPASRAQAGQAGGAHARERRRHRAPAAPGARGTRRPRRTAPAPAPAPAAPPPPAPTPAPARRARRQPDADPARARQAAGGGSSTEGVGLSPTAPHDRRGLADHHQAGRVAAPSTSGAADEWKFDFHGYFRAPLRISFGPPTPVNLPTSNTGPPDRERAPLSARRAAARRRNAVAQPDARPRLQLSGLELHQHGPRAVDAAQLLVRQLARDGDGHRRQLRRHTTAATRTCRRSRGSTRRS